jgi:HK97 family phage major capsid protein
LDRNFEEKIDETAGLVREAIKSFGSLGNRLDRIETIMGRPPIPASGKEAMTAEDKAFDAWLRKGDRAPETKVLTIGSDPSFGYACPPQLATDILHALTEGNPMRGLARVYNTSNTSLEVLKKSGSGVVVLQSSEVGEILETTELAYSKLTMTPKTRVYLLKAGVNFLEDAAVNVQQEIALELGEAFGTYEANDHINGTEGILANVGDGTLNTYKELHAGSTTAITAEKLMDLLYTLPTRFLPNAKWIMNRPTMSYIRQLKDAGTGTFLLSPLLDSAGQRLFGYPVVLNDNMPSIGSGSYVIGFGDWSKAFGICDRTPSFTVQRLDQPFAVYGIVGYLARQRSTSSPLVGEAAVFLQMSV